MLQTYACMQYTVIHNTKMLAENTRRKKSPSAHHRTTS